MSLLKKEKNNKTFFANLQKNALPVYILFSAAFIVYVLWVFITWAVYNSWLRAGQEQWYVLAFQEVANELMRSCDVVTLTLWDAQVNTINVDCLDMWQDDIMLDEDIFFEEQ